MNAARLMTNKWVLGLGAAVLFGLMSSVALADPPRHGGYGDGYRGGYDGHRGGYVNRDRDRGGDRDRGRSFAPAYRGGHTGYYRPVYVAPPVYRTPVVTYGGYGSRYGSGCVVTSGYRVTPGVTVTIIVR